jgi:excinuclease ABC subunit A
VSPEIIRVRGAAVHNLKHIDVDIPRQRLIVVCGLSGSGKTSLALDTLYAEGQRRYIDSFSAYTRQFLERPEKPEVERVDGIPPAVAVTHKNPSRSNRATIGASTETSEYLRLLLAKIGHTYCLRCGREVRRDSPQSVAERLAELPAGTRFQVAFAAAESDPAEIALASLVAELVEAGFVRAIWRGKSLQLTEIAAADPSDLSANNGSAGDPTLFVVVDRLAAGPASQRLRDSLETAFAKGAGRCQIFVEQKASIDGADGVPTAAPIGREYFVDGQPWAVVTFSDRWTCEHCGIDYPPPEPRLFNFNDPLGACPRCEGFGDLVDVDLALVVPDPRKSIAEGAIAPWTTPAYHHELEELLALAPDFNLRVNVPFAELTDEERRLIVAGVPERKFGGLDGFFAWLERRKYKTHIRVFLSRWRSYRQCPECHGARLRPEALATRVGGKNFAEIARMRISAARQFLDSLPLSHHEEKLGRMMLEAARHRLAYLELVGLGYLTLDRSLRTLSGGEAQRVALTTALGASLVNMLYVLDEPSVGLHPQDVGRLQTAIESLRDRGNTVVAVEHEESIIRAADQVIEIGPGAGERGGQVVFQGTTTEMLASQRSLTGDYLSGRRGGARSAKRRETIHGWIRLTGARGNNLQNITVEFPLGVLCLVTGVSGAGKSTLVEETLYPALCGRLRKEALQPLAFDDVFGDGQIEDVIMVDPSPIGRSPRSNPATYMKVFDEIRAVFAETIDAKTRNFDAGHFSFNVEGGRCTTCEGEGFIAVDMQFLPDVYMKCSQCGGTRYRKEILEIKYRGRSIAEVLDLTVREGFAFFRGRSKVQARLKRLIDVGLDYLRLGQPANTLSGGEAQRLKLANHLGTTRRGRSLFLLDEPTTGLHFQDVTQLLDCLEALLAVGHSLIVVEHNLQLMQAADYLIDLGPGAGDEGGRVVAAGTPEEVALVKESATGAALAPLLRSPAQEESDL